MHAKSSSPTTMASSMGIGSNFRVEDNLRQIECHSEHQYGVDDDTTILPLGDDATALDELAAKTGPRPLSRPLSIGYQG